MGVADEIQTQLVGNWTLDRSDNFEEALKEMGEIYFLTFKLKIDTCL